MKKIQDSNCFTVNLAVLSNSPWVFTVLKTCESLNKLLRGDWKLHKKVIRHLNHACPKDKGRPIPRMFSRKGVLRLIIVVLCTGLHPIFGACTIELPSERTAQKNNFSSQDQHLLVGNMKLILAAGKGDLDLCYKCQVSRLITPKLQNWILTSRFALIINTHINGSIYEFVS